MRLRPLQAAINIDLDHPRGGGDHTRSRGIVLARNDANQKDLETRAIELLDQTERCLADRMGVQETRHEAYADSSRATLRAPTVRGGKAELRRGCEEQLGEPVEKLAIVLSLVSEPEGCQRDGQRIGDLQLGTGEISSTAA